MKISNNGIMVSQTKENTLGWQDACYNTVYDIFDFLNIEASEHEKYLEIRRLVDSDICHIVDSYKNLTPVEDNHNLWITLAALCISLAKDISGKDIEVSEIAELLIKKQKDYGPENIARFGIIGICIRLNDKVARLENLFMKSGSDDFKDILKNTSLNSVSNETVLDTIIDIAGYCAIALMFITIDPYTEEPEFFLPISAV